VQVSRPNLSRLNRAGKNGLLAAVVGLIVVAFIHGASAETLKVAVAQRGFWNSTFIDVGLKQGYFKEAGLDLEILYTEGGASTLTPVIAGSIDIAMTNGVLGVVAAYAKGMPVKIISAEATGARRRRSGMRGRKAASSGSPTPRARRWHSRRPAPRPISFSCS
jgi:ABC-type nitrate/sulfonate/bicarbonate transport system substrate-binding protein